MILGKMRCRGPKALFGLFRNCLKPFLWLICSRFHGLVCEESMACLKHGLSVVWLESLPLGTVWLVLNSLNGRFVTQLWSVSWFGL